MIVFDKNEFGCKLIVFGMNVYEKQINANGLMVKIFNKEVFKREKIDFGCRYKIFFIKFRRTSKMQVLLEVNHNLSELIYAETFNLSTNTSKWLQDKSIYPGRWAIGFAAMYVLYRILNEVRPKAILELGLGQSTKVIAQYVDHYKDVSHILVEHDQNWIDLFRRQLKFPNGTRVYRLDCVIETFEDYGNVRSYENFVGNFKGQKFDFILVDAPFGGDMRYISRVDVLKLIPDCLYDSFIIVVDDVDRFSENVMLNQLKKRLDLCGIKHKIGFYDGVKRVAVVASEDLWFVTTM